MKHRTETILTILRVLAWIGMIGYAINCGGQITAVIIGIINAIAAKDIKPMYTDFAVLRESNLSFYIAAMSFVIAASAMFVQLWYLVVSLLSKLNIQSPFTRSVCTKMEQISLCLFAMWCVSLSGEMYMDWLSKRMNMELATSSVGSEFLFIAGIVYIISQIFRRGIELQEENQQTI